MAKLPGVSEDELERLRRENAALRERFELAPDAYYIYDLKGRFVDGNRRAEELIGVPREELIGKSFLDLALLPASQVPKAMKAILLGAAGRSTGPDEFLLRRPDGQNVWIEARTRPSRHEGKRVILGIARDISERKWLEEELQAKGQHLREKADQRGHELEVARARLDRQAAALVESETQYRRLFESAHDAILIFDPATEQVLEANSHACQLYGYSNEEFIGLSLKTISVDVERGEEEIDRTLRRGSAHRFETIQVRADGSLMNLEISASTVDFRGRRAILSINRDVTDRVAAAEALRKQEAQLQQSEKMEAVGRLAAGVAHDFNNLLTIIQNYAHIVQSELASDDPHASDLEHIHDAARRAARLTKKLVAFSAQQPVRPEVVDVNAAIQDTRRLVSRILRGDTHLELDLEGRQLCIDIDPSQLDRVLVNLIVNARDAMPTGGSITLATRFRELGGEEVPGLPGGQYVVLCVADTGTGMDEQTQARVFEPFFTTKRPGEGTGLGLSTVYGIVAQSNGGITVQSEPGAGTRFDLYLPLSTRAMLDRPEVVVPFPRGTENSETVLVIDDEPDVLQVVCSVLRTAGYNVLAAPNGGEALLIAESHPGEIDLLLSDVVMPYTSGPEIAHRIASLRPDLSVAFMSGLARGVGEPQLPPIDRDLLQKPFTPDKLLDFVRRVLNDPRSQRVNGQTP